MIRNFHKNCFVCGKCSKNGLKLKFVLRDDNTLCGKFRISEEYQGYDGILHGGIITAILDSSMIHLFHIRDGIELKTAKLNIRFRKSIPVTETITINAVADTDAKHFYRAKSYIKVNDTIFAEAEGYFRKC
jgi:acyl-coenzyme A thioesterase PaaI-like protein